MNRRLFHVLLSLILPTLATGTTGCGDDDTSAPAPSPEVTITAPEDGAFVQGDVSVTAEVVGEVRNVALVVDGVVEQAIDTPPWSFTWASDSAEEGEHTVQVVAYGTGGARGESAVLHLFVDRTPPELTPPDLGLPVVLSGADNPITFSATDAAGSVTSLRLYADDALVGQCDASPCTISFDTTGRDDGGVVLRMEAEDEGGNLATATLPALVVNQGTVMTFIEGSPEAVFLIPENYASVEIDVKRHIDMPDGVAEMLVAVQWDRREWPFELSIGTGECPDSGTEFTAQEAEGGQVVFRYAAAELSLDAFPMGQWFLHVAPGSALRLADHVDEGSHLGFVAVIY